ncbi:MAG: sterol desaturase family protein [Gammaproteobacteria bacterium]
MTQYFRERLEEVPLTPGRGKISALVSVSLGTLSVLAALCFLMPQLLTSPELAAVYANHAGVFRTVLDAAIAVGFGFGLLAVVLGTRRAGLIGCLLASSAALLGTTKLDLALPAARSVYAGLDYFVLTLLILALVFIPLERLFPKYPNQRVLRGGWVTDMKYFMVSHIGVQIISFFTIIPIQAYLLWAVDLDFQAAIASQPYWLQFIEILFAVDIFTYWIHRLMHEVPWLWKFHAVHHSSEQMDWLSSSRLHVVEILVNRLFGYLPIFVLGFAPAPTFAYLVFISFHAIFIHSNTKLRFPGLRWVLATPEFHHWHHSSEDEAVDKNYAGFLPIYDVIFGTAHLPDHIATRYGTRSDTVPEGYLAQFLYPFQRTTKDTKP